MEEIWKDIPDYEGLYQVSNLGRIKSLSRIKLNRGKYPQIKPSSEKILVQALTGKVGVGYMSVCMTKNGNPKVLKTHQLVAIAFLGHVRCGHKLVINHKDLDRLNNKLDNLEIVTQRENANHKHLKSSSKYVGVTWDNVNNKWRAGIKIKNKRKCLGRYVSEHDAYLAYQKALEDIIRGT